jgi:hypothetical protein
MTRRKKVPLVKGEKRLSFKRNGDIAIERTIFCGECGKRTQSAMIRRNPKYAKEKGLRIVEEVARVCMNSEGHKDGKKHFWPIKEVVIPIY